MKLQEFLKLEQQALREFARGWMGDQVRDPEVPYDMELYEWKDFYRTFSDYNFYQKKTKEDKK
jgi:hypothetical protein